MPRPADRLSAATVVSYYRSVESTLLTQLRHRVVLGFGREVSSSTDGPAVHPVRLHIADLADLDEAVRSGIVGFRLPGLTGPGLVGLRIRPGEGSGIDTAATTALALTESMAADGLAATVLTDGADGLYLIAYGVGPVGPDIAAQQYATALAGRAPEIATVDRSDFDGRALILSLTDDGLGAPAPYTLVWNASLVWNAHEPGVVVPLTLDEVAAAGAGMPLEIGPADVSARITGYGDLAAALAQATAGPA